MEKRSFLLSSYSHTIVRISVQIQLFPVYNTTTPLFYNEVRYYFSTSKRCYNIYYTTGFQLPFNCNTYVLMQFFCMAGICYAASNTPTEHKFDFHFV